ncbi:nitrous oxide-stimulated promoter family protein [Wenzhouxiangella limi]
MPKVEGSANKVRRRHDRGSTRLGGPRMVWRHPWLSLMHLLDEHHRVETSDGTAAAPLPHLLNRPKRQAESQIP